MQAEERKKANIGSWTPLRVQPAGALAILLYAQVAIASEHVASLALASDPKHSCSLENDILVIFLVDSEIGLRFARALNLKNIWAGRLHFVASPAL